MRGQFVTSAQWQEPRIHFEGEARELEAADLHLTIYRTVRFTAAP
jgi:hypothetical protein